MKRGSVQSSLAPEWRPNNVRDPLPDWIQAGGSQALVLSRRQRLVSCGDVLTDRSRQVRMPRAFGNSRGIREPGAKQQPAADAIEFGQEPSQRPANCHRVVPKVPEANALDVNEVLSRATVPCVAKGGAKQ